MNTLKAFKYRIYPNKTQQEFLNRNFGAVRFIWNQFVASFNHDFVGPILPQDEKLLKDLPSNEWLGSCISYALQQKRMDWFEFKKQFFSKSRKSKLGRPKFKKKGISNDSFRIPIASMGGPKSVELTSGKIKLPKMNSIKMVVDRPFKGIPKSVTVSRNKIGQYFVSILVEEPLELKQNTGRSIGIDLGLIDLMTLSNGIKFKAPKLFRETQSKLKRAQQHLSRKQLGSNHYNKQKLKVAKIYNKITNQRTYINHVLSSWLVENYDTIIMEDLNVAGMKKLFGKSVSDAAFTSLVNMISYKSNWYGKTFHKIDRFYPSSKLCSKCGHKHTEMKLSIREWECPQCGTKHDRDLNAATNIINKGLNDLYDLTSDELTDYKRREIISPQVEMPKAVSVKRLASFIEIYKTA